MYHKKMEVMSFVGPIMAKWSQISLKTLQIR